MSVEERGKDEAVLQETSSAELSPSDSSDSDTVADALLDPIASVDEGASAGEPVDSSAVDLAADLAEDVEQAEASADESTAAESAVVVEQDASEVPRKRSLMQPNCLRTLSRLRQARTKVPLLRALMLSSKTQAKVPRKRSLMQPN